MSRRTAAKSESVGEYRCPSCGGTKVQAAYWVSLNDWKTHESADDDVWCPDCEEHHGGACLIVGGRCQHHASPFDSACPGNKRARRPEVAR